MYGETKNIHLTRYCDIHFITVVWNGICSFSKVWLYVGIILLFIYFFQRAGAMFLCVLLSTKPIVVTYSMLNTVSRTNLSICVLTFNILQCQPKAPSGTFGNKPQAPCQKSKDLAQLARKPQNRKGVFHFFMWKARFPLIVVFLCCWVSLKPFRILCIILKTSVTSSVYFLPAPWNCCCCHIISLALELSGTPFAFDKLCSAKYCIWSRLPKAVCYPEDNDCQ